MKSVLLLMSVFLLSAYVVSAQTISVSPSSATYSSASGTITFTVSLTYPAPQSAVAVSFLGVPPGWTYGAAAVTNVPGVKPNSNCRLERTRLKLRRSLARAAESQWPRYMTPTTGSTRCPGSSTCPSEGELTPDNPAITAGFVIRGSARKQVLIRGVGPGLAQLGVNAVRNPFLTLRSGATLMMQNDDWRPSMVSREADAVGAFRFETTSDAAILTTIPAGGYTVELTDRDNASASALLEIYEVEPR